MRLLSTLFVALSLVLVSCASETTRPASQQQPPLAENDTPQHAVQRFVGAYEQKKTAEYGALFTGDFAFEFSNSTDPDLVVKYSAGWLKTDEDTAAIHLFQGYTPQGQSHAPAASSINIDLTTTLPVDDNSPGLDPATHKILSTRVDGQIVIPPTGTATDPTNYLVENNYNAIYLVRGDQAVGLAASQPADDAHWYIYLWKDLTVSSAQPRNRPVSPQPAQASTWANLRANYR